MGWGEPVTAEDLKRYVTTIEAEIADLRARLAAVEAERDQLVAELELAWHAPNGAAAEAEVERLTAELDEALVWFSDEHERVLRLTAGILALADDVNRSGSAGHAAAWIEDRLRALVGPPTEPGNPADALAAIEDAWKRARGAVGGTEPAEVIIRRLRDGGPPAEGDETPEGTS